MIISCKHYDPEMALYKALAIVKESREKVLTVRQVNYLRETEIVIQTEEDSDRLTIVNS